MHFTRPVIRREPGFASGKSGALPMVVPVAATHTEDTKEPTIPLGLRLAGIFLRSVFVAALLVVTVRVALPQNERLWSVYETPGDLIRVALGLVAAIWIIAHLFMLPKDAEAYRTWVYLGLALAPLAVIVAIVVW
jgi:DMSO/TMAO reductase YedYZ heme-binding membrane subunit